jgi:alpha-D-ribose 1-methylphosphonate 5-triphosphate synthase subunit PhnL
MMNEDDIMIEVEGLSKSFTLHLRDGISLPVLDGVGFAVAKGACVVLTGPSGTGKSTLLRCLYGNYLAQAGHIRIRHDGAFIDLVDAAPWEILALRQRTIGYVSQFLRVIPRIGTIDLVMEPLLSRGMETASAKARAADMLTRLNIDEKLWPVPPATFSGGEQQRVNVARSFVAGYPILLLDEPTASLDADNRAAVVSLIRDACAEGTAIVGIFHDEAVRDAVATATFDLATQKAAA